MEMQLPEMWLARWKVSEPFDYVFNLKGEIFREQPGRKTLKFFESQQAYFVKMHFGVGWKEIFKNIFQFRPPILGAKNEVQAIQKLKRFQFTPELIAYGWRGKNPATQQSFVITKALDNTISLEDYCRDWKLHPPPLTLKWTLIKQIAHIAKTMHENGINHRDFYLCHFLLDKHTSNLYIIDLHRAQIRQYVPLRWQIKDIAGLFFSAMDCGLTKRDLCRFILHYNKTNKTHDEHFWKKVIIRAKKLYFKTFNKNPDLHYLQ